VLIATKWVLDDCRHGATHAILILLIMGELKNGQIIFKAGRNPQDSSGNTEIREFELQIGNAKQISNRLLCN
jgi:hypothetical protein